MFIQNAKNKCDGKLNNSTSANNNYYSDDEISHPDYFQNQFSEPISMSTMAPISINTNYTCSIDNEKSPR